MKYITQHTDTDTYACVLYVCDQSVHCTRTNCKCRTHIFFCYACTATNKWVNCGIACLKSKTKQTKQIQTIRNEKRWTHERNKNWSDFCRCVQQIFSVSEFFRCCWSTIAPLFVAVYSFQWIFFISSFLRIDAMSIEHTLRDGYIYAHTHAHKQ